MEADGDHGHDKQLCKTSAYDYIPGLLKPNNSFAVRKRPTVLIH